MDKGNGGGRREGIGKGKGKRKGLLERTGRSQEGKEKGMEKRKKVENKGS